MGGPDYKNEIWHHVKCSTEFSTYKLSRNEKEDNNRKDT